MLPVPFSPAPSLLFNDDDCVKDDWQSDQMIKDGDDNDTVANQVGFQLLDPRARPGGESALQHRSLRMSFPLPSAVCQNFLQPVPTVNLTYTRVNPLDQRHPVAKMIIDQAGADAADFSQASRRNLKILSASNPPGKKEIKVCN